MKLDEFVKLFAEQFDETEPDEIQPDTHFQELEEWSSLSAMSIIAFIKTQYGKTVTGKEIRSCETVQDVFELVKAK